MTRNKAPTPPPTPKVEEKSSKAGAKIEEIFAKLDSEKKKEPVEKEEKKEKSSTPTSDVILSKILGKNIRHDNAPMTYEPMDEDMALPFDHVPPVIRDQTFNECKSLSFPFFLR